VTASLAPGVPERLTTALVTQLGGHRRISLQALGEASLLTDRIDTKFLVPATDLAPLIALVGDRYRVLEVDDRMVFRYETRYFDTPELTFYRTHLARHYPRYKVRLRTYWDSALQVLELKRKTNRGRTVKLRRAVVGSEWSLPALLGQAPFAGEIPVAVERLCEIVTSRYRRVTLVRTDAAERVTLDFDLGSERGDRTCDYPGAAIVEVKQGRRQRSPVRDTLRAWHRRPLSVSKYVLGVALCLPHARRNGLRPLLQTLARAARDAGGTPRTSSPHAAWTTAISEPDC
jgi:hypothetical protein